MAIALRRGSSTASLVVILGAVAATSACKMPDATKSQTETEPAAAPKPWKKKVSRFFGMSLARMAPTDKCQKTLFTEEWPVVTVSCDRGRAGEQGLFQQYIFDDRLPDQKGRLLKAYVLLGRELRDNPTAMLEFLRAIEEKYGEMGSGLRPNLRFGLVTLCEDDDLHVCHEGGLTYDPAKRYIASGIRGDLFEEVAVQDMDLLGLAMERTEAADRERGRGAVR